VNVAFEIGGAKADLQAFIKELNEAVDEMAGRLDEGIMLL